MDIASKFHLVYTFYFIYVNYLGFYCLYYLYRYKILYFQYNISPSFTWLTHF